MKFYAITQKKDRGCPIGLLNAVLYDHCPENPAAIEHGTAYPWYFDPRGLDEYPAGMCLIAKEKLINFSIRSISLNQFLDQNFLESLIEFKSHLKDFKEIEVISQSSKKSIVQKKYFVSRFADEFYVSLSEAVNNNESFVRNGKFGLSVFEKLSIRQSFDRHVFGIEGLDPRIGTIFCSEEFFESTKKKGVAGIDFVRVEAAKWPNPDSFVFDPEEILPVL
ncbi:hypothetical protein NU688_16750 [Variovorax sp. ZS18.2.2]|uniref:Imm43 family immunity protein n=1 Tax=Variovorax sp. ZS18.2.2 TaxID=2971255 RepID=UPI002151EC70|nr:hypothetical protein [Variovorax sp. ZS18.2.2]MCR6477813.1 hypothetical protein [Variovorax sp. ZS18.2.2]